MVVTHSKLASLAIAVVYVIAIAISTGGNMNDILPVCLMLLVPLVLIWFPDQLGSVSPVRRGGNWATEGTGRFSESPGILVAAMGWFFLVGMPLIIYLLWS
jgi:hypothetical protein